MALQARELYSENDGPTYGRAKARDIRPVTFAIDASATLLQPLTPVAYNSSTDQWVPWDSDGANDTDTIRGFVWPDTVQLDTADQVLGNVMIAGEVHVDDIDLTYASESVADLKSAIQTGDPSLRQLGIAVQGLEKVR